MSEIITKNVFGEKMKLYSYDDIIKISGINKGIKTLCRWAKDNGFIRTRKMINGITYTMFYKYDKQMR